ncbi:MAG: hypothetical protein ABJ013_15005 [Halioglobus sp.]
MFAHRRFFIFILSYLLWQSHTALAQVLTVQELVGSGGDRVAISSEWAFVADIGRCQVNIYRYDYATNLWGDGAGNDGSTFQVLAGSGNPCKAASYAGFGASVSTAGELAVVGAPRAKSGGSIRHGRFFLYLFDGSSWVEQQGVGEPISRVSSTAFAEDLQNDSGFGEVVSVRFDDPSGIALILVGAPFYDDDNGTNNGNDDLVDIGKVYLYEWDRATDNVRFINDRLGREEGDQYGTAVTSNGIDFLAGAPGWDDPLGATDNNVGNAFLAGYDPASNTIIPKQDIIEDITQPSPPPPSGGALGVSVSLSSDGIMLVGGEDALTLREDAGGVYQIESTIAGTAGGDVSQSGGKAGFGFSGTKADIYPDNTDIPNTVPEFSAPAEAGSEEFSKDISLAGSRLIVNGQNGDSDTTPTVDIAYAYYAACGGAGQLQELTWTLISVSCNSDSIIDDIFDELGTYGANWAMYQQVDEFSGTTADYVYMNPTDKIAPGIGYWIIADADSSWAFGASDNPSTIVVKEDPLDRSTIAGVYPVDITGKISAPPSPSSDIKVMLGNPFTASINWSDTVISSDASGSALVENSGNFFEEGDTSAYVYNPVQLPGRGGYTAISSETPGLPRKIQSGEGYYVRFSQQAGESTNLTVEVGLEQ